MSKRCRARATRLLEEARLRGPAESWYNFPASEDIPVKVFLQTFGCRVNQCESESLRRELSGRGFVPCDSFEEAGLCLVNTCTVTREADKDALLLLRRIRRRNPSARILVTGCLASRAPEEIRAAAPSAEIVPNADKASLAALLGLPPRGCASGAFSGRSRAFVKVQDGCDMKCSFCVVPSVRPALRSVPPGEVEAEVRGYLEAGHREVVLCGVRLGRYEGGLAGLLERLAALPWDFRLRLSSLEVTDVHDGFLDAALRLGGKFCPSFHLPLQSGSESVLRRMGRWYSAAFYARRVEALRSALPGASLFSDVMAAFPGETEAEHRESLEFAKGLGFSGLHLFPFSARPGTPAALMPGGLGSAQRAWRMAQWRALDAESREAFAASAVGSRRRVVAEGPSEGTTDHFLKVRLDRDPGPGLRWARIVSSRGASAFGACEP
jgi:threonylcarbamoyladenosine tRNA methylthiotransferase MtaB